MDHPSTSSDEAPSSKRKRTYTSKACERCRKRKHRCSGDQPCKSCVERQAQCIFSEERDKRRRQSDPTRSETAEPRPTEDAATRDGITTAEPSTTRQRSTTASTHDRGPEITSPQAQFALHDRRNRFERLRKDTTSGLLVQHGETSFWSHALDGDPTSDDPTPVAMGSEWFDWSRNLPPGLNLSKEVHDGVLEHYGSYLASWSLVVDWPHFTADLITCNTMGGKWRTHHYSPFLHNVLLYHGMYFGRRAWPEEQARYAQIFFPFVMSLLGKECSSPMLSTIRALALLASCMNEPPNGSSMWGYTLAGMTVALSQGIGLNVPASSYVRSGRLTDEEKQSRDCAYWTVHVTDTLRAIGAGRPALGGSTAPIDFPVIDSQADDVPWHLPLRSIPSNSYLGITLNGMKGMSSTAFHFQARLCALYGDIRAALYPTNDLDPVRKEKINILSEQLERWNVELPAAIKDPEKLPLPHILALHMLYNLINIYLFRPFYLGTSAQSGSPAKKCDRAARQILALLKLFDQYHSVRNGPATLTNIAFTTMTVFLMEAVEAYQREGKCDEARQNIRSLGALMREISNTWWDASRALSIAKCLCQEWLPGVIDVDTVGQHPSDLTPNTDTLAPAITPQMSTMLPLQSMDRSTAYDPTASIRRAFELSSDANAEPGWTFDGDMFSSLTEEFGNFPIDIAANFF